MATRRPRRARCAAPLRWLHAAGAALAAFALACALPAAAAPSFAIEQVFSNADGTLQFVVLRESAGQNGQDKFAGLAMTATSAAGTRSFTFPHDLPHGQTSRRSVLVATQGYLDAVVTYPELGAVAPDFIAPAGLVPTGGGTLDFAGTSTFTFPALPADGFSARYRNGEPVRDNAAQNFSGTSVGVPVTRVTAVEYHHAGLDHYFISDLAADIDALDSGRIAGWARTGASFAVWPSSLGFLRPVCRFYIPPEHGNSHFFSASDAECTTVSGLTLTDPNYSGYVQETAEAFFVALPFADGACPTRWIPIYRLWNHRADANHRYTTDPAIKAQMVARGYVPEGYGPDAVAMCSPLPF